MNVTFLSLNRMSLLENDWSVSFETTRLSNSPSPRVRRFGAHVAPPIPVQLTTGIRFDRAELLRQGNTSAGLSDSVRRRAPSRSRTAHALANLGDLDTGKSLRLDE